MVEHREKVGKLHFAAPAVEDEVEGLQAELVDHGAYERVAQCAHQAEAAQCCLVEGEVHPPAVGSSGGVGGSVGGSGLRLKRESEQQPEE